MEDIYNRFTNYVLSNSLISGGDRILLSLSAGKDSMFMLHLLKKFQCDMNFELGIFHLNHLTRGDETDKDENFIREKSEELHIPCHIERFDFTNNRLSGISFEEHAREIRYSLLNRISGTGRYSKIATAHNMNDNAETLLMRIFSGTGIAGLKGILPVSKNIIRPVLFAEKSEIYEYLGNNNIEWREDLSNGENLYLRNNLRNIIIPLVKERFPMAEESLNNLAAHAAENQSLLHNLAVRLYPGAVFKNGDDIIIDIDNFRDDIPLIKFFISSVLYENYGIKMKISLYNEIVKRFVINSANMILYEKDKLIIRKSLWNGKMVIQITDKSENQNIHEEWEYSIHPDRNTSVCLSEIRKELKVLYVDYDYYNSNKNNPDIVFIQPENNLEIVTLRNRRPGDRIRIESGTKKIKDLMIEKKLDSRIKNSIPLIVADNKIAAYLPGLVNTNNNRVACNFHISNDTKRILAFFFRDY